MTEQPLTMSPGRALGSTIRLRIGHIDPWLWALVPLLFALTVVFLLPIGTLLLTSLHESLGPAQMAEGWTIANYREFFSDRYFLGILWQTVELGLIVVLCCAALGYPVAYFLARQRSRWRGLLQFLVISPLLISAVIRNVGWLPILSENGLINWILLGTGMISAPIKLVANFTGIVIGLVHALVPFMILTLSTAIQRIEPEIEEAAASLGAGPVRNFFQVILPLSLPGLVAGSLLVFTMAVSAYTTPAILGGNRIQVMPIYIAQQFRAVLDYPAGATAAAVLMIAAALLTLASMRLRIAGSDRK